MIPPMSGGYNTLTSTSASGGVDFQICTAIYSSLHMVQSLKSCMFLAVIAIVSSANCSAPAAADPSSQSQSTSQRNNVHRRPWSFNNQSLSLVNSRQPSQKSGKPKYNESKWHDCKNMVLFGCTRLLSLLALLLSLPCVSLSLVLSPSVSLTLSLSSRTHIHTHARTRTYSHVRARTQHADTHKHTHTHAHAHAHTHAHTHVHGHDFD